MIDPAQAVAREVHVGKELVRLAAQMIDHAWAVALNRAHKAGILLAHILMSGAHGDRPVTLIGYSMGARLIFHCLLELCRHSAKGGRSSCHDASVAPCVTHHVVTHLTPPVLLIVS